MKKIVVTLLFTFLLSGSLLAGCSSKSNQDSTINLEEQERTRDHKKEFGKNMES